MRSAPDTSYISPNLGGDNLKQTIRNWALTSGRLNFPPDTSTATGHHSYRRHLFPLTTVTSRKIRRILNYGHRLVQFGEFRFADESNEIDADVEGSEERVGSSKGVQLGVASTTTVRCELRKNQDRLVRREGPARNWRH